MNQQTLKKLPNSLAEKQAVILSPYRKDALRAKKRKQSALSHQLSSTAK